MGVGLRRVMMILKMRTGDEDNGMDEDQNSMGQRLRSRLGEEFEIVDVTSRQVAEQT